mgnify:CR=1 FL=1
MQKEKEDLEVYKMKQRTITAMILLAICIPLLILGGYYLAIAVALIGCMGGYELLTAQRRHNPSKQSYPIFVILLTFVGILSLLFLNYHQVNGKVIFNFDFQEGRFTYLGISLAPIILFLILLLCSSVISPRFSIQDAFYLFTMVVLITLGLQSFLYIRSLVLNPNLLSITKYQAYRYEDLNGIYICLYLLVTTMMTDTGAYLGGMLYRKLKKPIHFLAPRVSPKKTIEGAIAGTICGTLFGSLIFGLLVCKYELTLPMIVYILLSLFLSIMAQFGDLIFSCIKRHYEIKDFSDLLPGHGGVLDRIDSLIINSILLGSFFSIFIQTFSVFVG